MTVHKKEIRGVVLKVGPNQYLRHTDADWGPRYTTCNFSEAAVFDSDDDYGINRVCRDWGANVRRVPVRVTITKTMVLE